MYVGICVQYVRLPRNIFVLLKHHTISKNAVQLNTLPHLPF